MKITTSTLTTLKPFNLSNHMKKVKLLHYNKKIKHLRNNKIKSSNIDHGGNFHEDENDENRHNEVDESNNEVDESNTLNIHDNVASITTATTTAYHEYDTNIENIPCNTNASGSSSCDIALPQ